MPLDFTDLGRPAPDAGPKPPEPTPATSRSPTWRCWSRRSAAPTRRSAIAPQHSPWLPALPDRAHARRPARAARPSPTDLPAVAWALADLPRQQAQRADAIGLDTLRAHARRRLGPQRPHPGAAHDRRRAGRRGSAPATCTCTASTAATAALLPLADLPHCGAVVQRTQPDRVIRLLAAAASTRWPRGRRCWRSGGFADLTEQRSTRAAGRAAAARRAAARPLGGLPRPALADLDGGKPQTGDA